MARSGVRRALVVIAVAAGLWTAVPRAQGPDRHWVATWGTAQQSYRSPAGPPGPPRARVPAPPATGSSQPPPATARPAGPARRFGVPAPLRAVNGQTLRMIVRTSLGGPQVRIRLAQAFGAPGVTIGSAHVALRAEGPAIRPGTDRVLTFSGQPTARLYAGQVLYSDPVTLDVPPLTDLAVSLYLPDDTGPPTTHLFGLRPTYLSAPGDSTGAATFEPVQTLESYYWLAGVDVLAPASAAALVTFGDSITDGDQSTPDTNGMWPAVLAERLQGRRSGPAIGVVNAGISGNRVLGDNGSGLARFSRDALDVPGVRWITVLEGINDISGATRVGTAGTSFTSATLIAAYRQMIAAAHDRGVLVIGCTLTPYGGSSAFAEAGERIRQEVNDWIRTGGGFDAVIDFDRATRDAADPLRFAPATDSPDLLHPANPGYKMMAESIPLSLFENPRGSRR